MQSCNRALPVPSHKGVSQISSHSSPHQEPLHLPEHSQVVNLAFTPILSSSMTTFCCDALGAWHPFFSLVVTPGSKTSSQSTLPSADHFLVGHTGASVQSIRSQSGTCLHLSWKQLLPPFCQDWTLQVSPRRMWSPLFHPMHSGAYWQKDE